MCGEYFHVLNFSSTLTIWESHMDKDQARINQLTLEINRIKHEYNKRQNKINAIRERVVGRFVCAGFVDNPSRLHQLQIKGLTLDSFVTKAVEREVLGLAPRPSTKRASDGSDQ